MEAIIDVAWERLRPGGRLVVNAITLENVNETYQALRKRDLVPEVTLVQISRGEPLARYLRYEALNPIQIFAVSERRPGMSGPDAVRRGRRPRRARPADPACAAHPARRCRCSRCRVRNDYDAVDGVEDRQASAR